MRMTPVHLENFTLPVWHMEKIIIKEEVDIFQVDESIIFLQREAESLFVFRRIVQYLGGPQIPQFEPETEAEICKSVY